MKKPVYQHPDFVTDRKDFLIKNENKRLWLSLTIDKKSKETLLVILKNPSRATKDISDKTVSTVTKYVHKNKCKYAQLKNIGRLVILNLIPFYQTYSELLAKSHPDIFDKQNMQEIAKFASKHKQVIIAWGDHPVSLREKYNNLKKEVLSILKTNNCKIYYVGHLSRFGNPKHGQIWCYKDELKAFA